LAFVIWFRTIEKAPRQLDDTLRLKGRNQLPKVIEGTKFNDGVEATDDAENRAA
jgi:hypothetical protein